MKESHSDSYGHYLKPKDRWFDSRLGQILNHRNRIRLYFIAFHCFDRLLPEQAVEESRRKAMQLK